MDVKSLAESLDQMEMFPYFILSHIIVNTLNVRSDLGTGSLYFSRKHPLACWISTLLCIFSGTILSNFFLNEPVISALGNSKLVIWASISWYLIFYSPFDIVYRICQFIPVKIIIQCMNEVHNCKAVYSGIIHAAKIFPDSYVIMAFIGIARGSGQGFTKLLERLIRGTWSIGFHELMNPSYTTKMSTVAAVIFITNKYSEYFMISQPLVFFCVACASIYFRLSAILLNISDPFGPLESILCQLFFGGIWDAIARAIMIDEQSRRLSSPGRVRAMRAELITRANRS